MLRERSNKQRSFDIVLIDFELQDMNGLVLAGMINAENAINPAHLILSHSSSRLTQSQRSQQVGFHAQLVAYTHINYRKNLTNYKSLKNPLTIYKS